MKLANLVKRYNQLLEEMYKIDDQMFRHRTKGAYGKKKYKLFG